MTRDELREKVADAINKAIEQSGEIIDEGDLADAAIAVVMAEAAKASRPPAHMLGSADSYANGYRAACADIAAALRAYIRDPEE